MKIPSILALFSPLALAIVPALIFTIVLEAGYVLDARCGMLAMPGTCGVGAAPLAFGASLPLLLGGATAGFVLAVGKVRV